MKIACGVAYDGTRYAGWQIQPDVLTVQGTIEEKLSLLFERKTKIQGAGRTDAGVHARSQFFTFEMPEKFPAKNLLSAINSLLPSDIVVFSHREVPLAFDVRRDARLRWYRYCFYHALLPDPFERHFSFWIKPPFNWEAVKEAIPYFQGENDFSAFRSSQCTANRVILTIEEASLSQDGYKYYFDIKARSFLHNMVRICAGTLWEVGKGNISSRDIPAIFSSKERKRAGKTLSPRGLFLMGISYNEQINSPEM